MIVSLYAKNALSFDEIQLSFHQGLNVLTGPSGAGKSILIQTLLSPLALRESLATKAQLAISHFPHDDTYDISFEDETLFYCTKNDKTRYFINNIGITKKALTEKTSSFIGYIGPKEKQTFSSTEILSLFDHYISTHHSSFHDTLTKFQDSFSTFQSLRKEILSTEKILIDKENLREFIVFECAKIEALNPKEGEEEELLNLKKELSRQEKSRKLLYQAQKIFDHVTAVSQVYELMQENDDIFLTGIENFRTLSEHMNQRLESLDDIKPDELLDRLEKLSSLTKRYGSITQALSYLEAKKVELSSLDSVELTLKNLKKSYEQTHQSLLLLADDISYQRQHYLHDFESYLNTFILPLSLPYAHLTLSTHELYSLGSETLSLHLAKTPLDKISSGESNRLKLALLALQADLYPTHQQHILIVDEIDANLSGEEAAAVASTLHQLSSYYQVFAISHQAQLTAKADAHFLVTKIDEKSYVKTIIHEERITELARILSGDNITTEALDYAKTLLATQKTIA